MGRALTLSALLFSAVARAGPYEDCILESMKGVQDRVAAYAVQAACKEKTTPLACRASAIKEQKGRASAGVDVQRARDAGYSDLEIDLYLRDECLKRCAAASWYERRFGDCRTD